MLIDTHAHVNFRAYKDDAKEVIDRALENGTWVINIGSQIDTSRQAVEMANLYPKGVYAVVGLHPEHTHAQYVDEEETHFKSREEKFDFAMYKSLAENPKVVGIGECGLDYYRLPEDADHNDIKEKQKEAFRAQVRLAKELNKTLVVHSRPAKDSEELFDDLLAILDEESAPQLSEGNGGASPPGKGEYPAKQGEVVGKKLRFVVHSFTGSPEYLERFIARGGFVSFNGIITFGDQKNKNRPTSAEAFLSGVVPLNGTKLEAKAGDRTGNMEKLVKMAPMDRIVLETDSPYLTPVPYRGKRNEPAYVSYVAQKVAEMKGVDAAEVSRITTENALRLFHLPNSSGNPVG